MWLCVVGVVVCVVVCVGVMDVVCGEVRVCGCVFFVVCRCALLCSV